MDDRSYTITVNLGQRRDEWLHDTIITVTHLLAFTLPLSYLGEHNSYLVLSNLEQICTVITYLR